ncbi:MFS transporter [Amycolatopsis deserti]|uniref:MFS transporter n=1 Tax=Amycolatopsis deserti TaxID=185696 RepID=A0ABQ3IGP0_9PSEU|nr:MFS transporter [Amycolatopsis deserti]GHE80483.1 MFS transporter [Amycolatopsis deserti]
MPGHDEPVAPPSAGRIALASYIGTTIEYYDFFIYGLAATLVFRTEFFPQFSEASGTLAALGTFAVGFIARPVGGIVMGHFGDRVGRKSMLVFALLTMGIATTLIGVLPTYSQIGIWAPILLVVLRLVQGVGVGGEWSGAVLMALENAPPRRRALYASFPQIGLPTGILLSQLVFLVLSSSMSRQAFVSWGWRIAFLTSAVLIVVGLVIRLRFAESPQFARVKAADEVKKLPVLEVFRTSWRQVLVGGFGSIAVGALGYLVSLFLVQYGVTTLGLSTTTMLWCLSGVSVLWIGTTLLGGLGGDVVGRRRTFAAGAVLAIAWAFPMFLLMDSRAIPLILLALAVPVLANSLMGGTLPSLLTEMFPTSVRYSGSSLCYTLGSILGGGLTPLLSTALLTGTGTTVSVSLLFVAVPLISLLAFLLAGRLVRRVDDPVVAEPASQATPTGTSR